MPTQLRFWNERRQWSLVPAASVDGARIILPDSRYPGGTVSGVAYGAIFYVATNGVDVPIASGGGTAAAPFLTPNYAVAQMVAALDFGGQAVLLQAVAGHAAFTTKLHITPWVGGGAFIYDGGGGSIAVTVDKAILIDGGPLPGPFTYQNVTLSATFGSADPNSGRGVDILSASTIHQGAGVTFGACGGHQIFVGTGGFLNIDADYSITGGGVTHWNVGNAGLIFIQNPHTITLTGTPAYTGSFASAVLGGTLFVGGQTFSGAATGQRFNASLNGIIATGGGGINYFPGNVAGTTSTGGQYS
jgi:hypothetical protein